MRTYKIVTVLAVALLACAYVLAPDFAHAAHAPLAVAMIAMPAAGTQILGSAALSPIPRAVHAMPRADASDPKKVLAELQAAFEDFKKTNEEKLKSKADVVLDEKVQRIDAAVDNFQKAIDEINAKVAAAGLDAAGVIGDLPASDPEYVSAFKAHMRRGDVGAAMQKATDSAGGYLAPVEWDRTITGKLKEVSPIRANARVMTITTNGFSKLFTDRAVGSGWVGETASRPATSTPALASLDFNTGEIYANPAITQQLLDDAAINLEEWLASEVDTEFARQEGIAFLSGDGSNKPYGLLTYVTGAANAARHPWGAIEVVNSGAAAALTADGILDLFGALPEGYRASAKVYTGRGAQTAMRKLKDGQNNYLWQPSYAAGQPATLAGETIVSTPDMPAVAADAIAMLYGDMEQTYLVVDRVGIRVLRDPFTNKPFVQFYTTKRVGGGVVNPEPMKALKIAVNA